MSVISDLSGEEIIGTFYGKELQKQSTRVEKVINKKGDKLYVKQRGYDNSFNSQIDKKDIVTATGPEPTTAQFLNEYSTIQPSRPAWLND